MKPRVEEIVTYILFILSQHQEINPANERCTVQDGHRFNSVDCGSQGSD